MCQVFRSIGHIVFEPFHVRYDGRTDGKDVLVFLAHAFAADALAESDPFVAGWHEGLNLAFELGLSVLPSLCGQLVL